MFLDTHLKLVHLHGRALEGPRGPLGSTRRAHTDAEPCLLPVACAMIRRYAIKAFIVQHILPRSGQLCRYESMSYIED